MSHHRIYLRGPWEYELPSIEHPNAGQAATRRSGRIHRPAPANDVFGSSDGPVKLRRRFQWPAVLDAGERVMLVIEELAGQGAISLNNERLGQFTPPSPFLEYDITGRLRSTNLLEIELRPVANVRASTSAPLWNLVALEVRQAADRSVPATATKPI